MSNQVGKSIETIFISKIIRRVAGFTLLELMLALGIFAALAILTTVTLSSVLSTGEVTGLKSTHLAAMQRAQLFLRRDIEQLVPRPIRDEFDTQQPALKGNAAGAEFTRAGWRNPLPNKHIRSELQRVSYFMEEGKLIRRYWHVLDRAQDSEPVDTTMLADIDDFVLRYFDPLDKQWTNEWPPLDPDRQQDLPAVIEVTINSKPFGEIKRLMALVGANE